MKLLLQIFKENPLLIPRIELLSIDLDFAFFNCVEGLGGERGGAEVKLLEGHAVHRQLQRIPLLVVLKFELQILPIIHENLELNWIKVWVVDPLSSQIKEQLRH